MARVLIVDDDANIIGVLCATLVRAGHSVERASSGHEALEIIEKGAAVDLLLTDVKMPWLHGFALARMARMRRPRLRVIYITGDPAAAEIKADDGAKLGPVLPKTISSGDLLNAIEKALASPPSRPRKKSPVLP
jgi:CheY-like chemotaxis protein